MLISPLKTKAEDKMKKRMTAFANFGMLTPSPVVFKNQPCLCGVDIQRFNEEIVDLLQTLRCAAYGFDVASYNDVESVGSGYVVCRGKCTNYSFPVDLVSSHDY